MKATRIAIIFIVIILVGLFLIYALVGCKEKADDYIHQPLKQTLIRSWGKIPAQNFCPHCGELSYTRFCVDCKKERGNLPFIGIYCPKCDPDGIFPSQTDDVTEICGYCGTKRTWKYVIEVWQTEPNKPTFLEKKKAILDGYAQFNEGQCYVILDNILFCSMCGFEFESRKGYWAHSCPQKPEPNKPKLNVWTVSWDYKCSRCGGLTDSPKKLFEHNCLSTTVEDDEGNLIPELKNAFAKDWPGRKLGHYGSKDRYWDGEKWIKDESNEPEENIISLWVLDNKYPPSKIYCSDGIATFEYIPYWIYKEENIPKGTKIYYKD